MNDIRIRQYVDDIFKDVKMTETAIEQKEELTVNITERVRDYMRDGLSFDAAFETAMTIVGDTNELTAPFEKLTQTQQPEKDVKHPRTKPTWRHWQLAALSPFVYIFLGFMFGWWAWAWVIIPMAGIIESPIPPRTKLVSMSPFIYVMLGFFFGLWAWGWIIIPVAGILASREYV